MHDAADDPSGTLVVCKLITTPFSCCLLNANTAIDTER